MPQQKHNGQEEFGTTPIITQNMMKHTTGSTTFKLSANGSFI
jgi:hypothetical protein